MIDDYHKVCLISGCFHIMMIVTKLTMTLISSRTWYLLEGGDLTGRQWNATAGLFARFDLKQITLHFISITIITIIISISRTITIVSMLCQRQVVCWTASEKHLFVNMFQT